MVESVSPQLHRDRWLTLATIALGVSLIIMDATIVNVALPVVINDLHLDATQAEWMNAVYALTFAALLLTVGRIGDLHGRRRVFLTGTIVFVVASIGAGRAESGGMLIAARFTQGVGAAMILPATLSTLNAIFTGRERSIAFAVWGSTIGGMAAVGPFVGGWLTTDFTWRWAFWLNVPVGLVVLAGILAVVPETRDEHASSGVDVAGVFTSAIALGAIVFALIEGQHYGWWRSSRGTISPVPISLAGGLFLLVAFVYTQHGRAKRNKTVLVDLTLLSIRSFRYGVIAALVVALGEFGLLFALPLLLQNALGYDALGTGRLIIALALGTFFSSGMTPQLTTRLGSRSVVRAGLALEAVAVGGLSATVTTSSHGLMIAGWLFLYGVGVGMATAQLTSVILVDVPVAQSGQASGLQSTFRQIGSALGVAILGTLLVTTLSHTTSDNLSRLSLPHGMASGVTQAVRHSAGAAIPGLKHQSIESWQAARSAMIHAAKVTTGWAAVILLAGLVATLALPQNQSARKTGQ